MNSVAGSRYADLSFMNSVAGSSYADLSFMNSVTGPGYVIKCSNILQDISLVESNRLTFKGSFTLAILQSFY
jgi:hypothetical protein